LDAKNAFIVVVPTELRVRSLSPVPQGVGITFHRRDDQSDRSHRTARGRALPDAERPDSSR
jgi:hypothetical protein